MGIVSTRDAMDRARNLGLDLVEVSPMEKPPVCRIMDYGKHMYEKKKKLKSSQQAHQQQLKEIRIRPKTDPHDLELKLNRAIKFLGDGDKVQFTMIFRGRERFNQDWARKIFDNIIEVLGERIKVIGHPIMAGKRMTLVVQPATTSTPKPHAKPAKGAAKPDKGGSKQDKGESQAEKPGAKGDKPAAGPQSTAASDKSPTPAPKQESEANA